MRTRCSELADEATMLTDPPLILPRGQTVPSESGPVVAVQIPPGLPHIYNLRGLYLDPHGC